VCAHRLTPLREKETGERLILNYVRGVGKGGRGFNFKRERGGKRLYIEKRSSNLSWGEEREETFLH